MKALLFFILAIVIYAFIRFTLNRINSNRGQEDLSQERPPKTEEEMVTCAQCGVHVPISEAFVLGATPEHSSDASEEIYFCSREHLQRYRQEHADD